MKSYMCRLHLASFITQYSLLPFSNVCGNKKVLFGNFNLETETFNLYMWHGGCFTDVIFSYFCGRQEEPAILISRLLLHMRRMYVASIRLDFH